MLSQGQGGGGGLKMSAINFSMKVHVSVPSSFSGNINSMYYWENKPKMVLFGNFDCINIVCTLMCPE